MFGADSLYNTLTLATAPAIASLKASISRKPKVPHREDSLNLVHGFFNRKPEQTNYSSRNLKEETEDSAFKFYFSDPLVKFFLDKLRPYRC